MCIRDRFAAWLRRTPEALEGLGLTLAQLTAGEWAQDREAAVSYTHLRAHETVLDLVCRLLLDTKNSTTKKIGRTHNYLNE